MFSLEHELELRKQIVDNYDKTVEDVKEKERIYLEAKAGLEAIGDVEEIKNDILIIEKYLGISHEPEAVVADEPICEVPQDVVDSVTTVY